MQIVEEVFSGVLTRLVGTALMYRPPASSSAALQDSAAAGWATLFQNCQWSPPDDGLGGRLEKSRVILYARRNEHVGGRHVFGDRSLARRGTAAPTVDRSQQILGEMSAELPALVSERQGRFRSRVMPLPLTICRHLVRRAVGDPAAVTELLAPVVSIGKKRGAGHGHILSWRSPNSRTPTGGSSRTCIPTAVSGAPHPRRRACTRSTTCGS